MGFLAALPVSVAMLPAWKYDRELTFAWVVLFGFFWSLRLFSWTPTLQMISTAVCLGGLFSGIIAQ
jgi:hypothetical protein